MNNFFQKIIPPILAMFLSFSLLGVPSSRAFAASPLQPASLQSSISTNWSGYIADSGKYSAIGATWKIPLSTMSGASISSDAAWVGIGGSSSRDLIQAGTLTLFQGGTVSYEAWYEALPGAMTEIPVRVSPGDSVTVSLLETSPGVWSISFKNNTTGQNSQQSVKYASSDSSAEWIQEMPLADGGMPIPLDHFGALQFTNAWTDKNGTVDALSDSGANPVALLDSSGQALATPTGIVANSSSFSVNESPAASPVASLATAADSGSYSFSSGPGGIVYIVSFGAMPARDTRVLSHRRHVYQQIGDGFVSIQLGRVRGR